MSDLQDELRAWYRRATDEQARWWQACNDRDEARAQLAAATARVAVLDAALEDVLDDADKMDGWAHLTSSQIRTLLTDLDPLTAAVVRVVAAAITSDECAFSSGAKYARCELESTVDALRALAPWWPH